MRNSILTILSFIVLLALVAFLSYYRTIHTSALSLSLLFIASMFMLGFAIYVFKGNKNLIILLSLGGTGIILNYIVMLANNGYMPVHPDICEKFSSLPAGYICNGNLLWMGDCYIHGCSLGDFFLIPVAMILIIISLWHLTAWVISSLLKLRGKYGTKTTTIR
jgi:hypothetical protein